MQLWKDAKEAQNDFLREVLSRMSVFSSILTYLYPAPNVAHSPWLSHLLVYLNESMKNQQCSSDLFLNDRITAF